MKFTKPQYSVVLSTRPITLFMGGWGSGKTAILSVISGKYVSAYPEMRGLIAANTYGQLNKSTLFRVRELWRTEFGWEEYSDKCPQGNYVVGKQPPKHFDTSKHNYDSYSSIISFANGAIIYYGSLDNYKALDGMEIGWAMLDETKDTPKEALEEVIISRLRQKGLYVNGGGITNEKSDISICPLYIVTAPAKVPWINEMFELADYQEEIRQKVFSKDYFRKDIGNKKVVICSTYSNEANLVAGYIENLKASIPSHLIDLRVYGYPFAQSGGEFYGMFERMKHVGICNYDLALPLHITFDENYVPYMPAGIWQGTGKKVFKIGEIKGEDPHNNAPWVCSEIIRRYSGHGSGMFIYGDATSQKGDPRQRRIGREKENLYTLIKHELKQFKPVLRVPSINPSVAMRGLFINTIFEKNYGGIEILISETCTETINDFMFVKEGADGGKLKTTVKDKETGQSFQPFSHFSDADDYFLCQYFKDDYSRFANPRSGAPQPPVIGQPDKYMKF